MVLLVCLLVILSYTSYFVYFAMPRGSCVREVSGQLRWTLLIVDFSFDFDFDFLSSYFTSLIYCTDSLEPTYRPWLPLRTVL